MKPEQDKIATVTFVAHMIQRDSRERTAFQETSTFEKIGGVWMYLEGKIEDPPGREDLTDVVAESDDDGEVVEVEENPSEEQEAETAKDNAVIAKTSA